MYNSRVVPGLQIMKNIGFTHGLLRERGAGGPASGRGRGGGERGGGEGREGREGGG